MKITDNGCLERVLAPTERPSDLVRRRLEQAGYDVADGLQTLGADEIGFLIKFIYKSNLLGGAGVSCFVVSFSSACVTYFSSKRTSPWKIMNISISLDGV